MDNLHDYIVGECMEMCPDEEMKMREKQKLIHILEVLPGTEKCSTKKIDKSRMVKAYSRSAAGKVTQDPKALRPPNVLLNTVKYLLNDVVSREDVHWTIIYEFILDRLRSIRQDMVIQNIFPTYFIGLIQPMIRFHAYAAYRLCEEPLNVFDPHINSIHLQECLKRLLCAYDYCEQLNGVNSDLKDVEYDAVLKSRPNFEAMYLILNIGNGIAITRALNLSKKWRTEVVESALRLSLCCLNNNFVKSCRIIKTLPILLLMMASLHLPALRRTALKIMSSAYNSKNLRFPVNILKDLLLYDENNDVIKECKYYGLEVQNNSVCFLKSTFDINKATMPARRHKFIDEKIMNVNISSFILLGD